MRQTILLPLTLMAFGLANARDYHVVDFGQQFTDALADLMTNRP